MNTNYDAAFAALAAVSLGVWVAYSLFMLAICVLLIVANWKIYVKAGKPGWACIVPFYSQYCLYDFTWGSGWMFLLQFIPCVNFVVLIMTFFKLAKSFGKGTGFGFGLWLLSPIFLLILAFGDAEYIGPAE